MDLDIRLRQTFDLLALPVPEGFLEPYKDPQRKYHNLSHLEYVFGALDTWGIQHTPVFELALWAHDLVYDTSRLDNEIRSVQAVLGQVALTPAQRLEFEGLVMATAHLTQTPQDEAQRQIVDLDLAILSDAQAYPAYAKAIREEYSMYPEGAYRKGRLRVLKSFVRQTWIYRTADFRVNREVPARWNLHREIEELERGN